MDVRVERHALAHAGHDGETRQLHASAHEQHQVLVASLAERRHLKEGRGSVTVCYSCIYVQTGGRGGHTETGSER